MIACFDVIGDRLTKAKNFANNVDIGNAVDFAEAIYREGIDEIVFYDILASSEKRSIKIDTVYNVAKKVFVPFTVGGGLKSVDDMRRVLDVGAEKISIDSMAVRNPNLIEQGARMFGSQCIVLSMQAKKVVPSKSIPSGYEIFIDGARQATNIDAVRWAKEAEERGAGEIVVNSIDMDGVMQGYDIALTKKVAMATKVPIIASGGAGNAQHLIEAFQQIDLSGAIISSILYSPRMKNIRVEELKKHLSHANIPIRPFYNYKNTLRQI